MAYSETNMPKYDHQKPSANLEIFRTQPGPERPDLLPVTSTTLEDNAVVKPTYELPAKNLHRKGNEDKFYHFIVPKEQENYPIDNRKLNKVKSDFKAEKGVGAEIFKSNLIKEDMIDIHE